MFQSPPITAPPSVGPWGAAHFSSPAASVSIVGSKARRIGEKLGINGVKVNGVPSRVSGELISSETDAHDRDDSQYATVASFHIRWPKGDNGKTIERGTPLVIYQDKTPDGRSRKGFNGYRWVVSHRTGSSIPTDKASRDAWFCLHGCVVVVTAETIVVPADLECHVPCVLEHMTEVKIDSILKKEMVAGTTMMIGLHFTHSKNDDDFTTFEDNVVDTATLKAFLGDDAIMSTNGATYNTKTGIFLPLRFGMLLVPYVPTEAGMGARVALSAMPNFLAAPLQTLKK